MSDSATPTTPPVNPTTPAAIYPNAFMMADSETQLELLFQLLKVDDKHENFPLSRVVLHELHKVTKENVR
jgi:hypothetical protein